MLIPESIDVRVRYNMPEEYSRAIRIRAAYEDVYPRDILVRALDLYLAAELAAVRESSRSIPQSFPTTPEARGDTSA